MEFTIDYSLVRRIVSQEYRQARVDILSSGPTQAYERSQRRHDLAISTASDVARLACKPGCSWCCYFSVDVRPVEVFTILHFMAQTFTPAERERIASEVEVNRHQLAGLDDLERARRNVKCPFLVGGRCTIYPVRPQTCRNYHATDATGCQQSFEQPELDIAPDYAPLVYQIGHAHVDAFSKAMHDAGYDTNAYEMNHALSLALQQPLIQGFLEKRPVFVQLDGVDVGFEFVELAAEDLGSNFNHVPER